MAHAQLAESRPELLNLRWYGGFNPLGYSVGLLDSVMALLGVRLTTALAYVLSVVFFAALLKITNVPRPIVGAITGAVVLRKPGGHADNVSELALAVGLGALLALAGGRLWLASVLSVVAALISGVTGLFLGVAGGALFLSGRRRDGITLAASRMVPTVAVGVAFGNGGLIICLKSNALVGLIRLSGGSRVCVGARGGPVGLPTVGRTGCRGVSATYTGGYDCDTSARAIRDPLRPMRFSGLRLVVVIASTVATVLPYRRYPSPRYKNEVIPRSSAQFYAPLLDQLTTRGVAGPIEVAGNATSWRGRLRTPVVPIARGWSRQIDIGRNPIFYDGTSTRTRTENGWTTTPSPTWSCPPARTTGQQLKEVKLLSGGLPYLRQVWKRHLDPLRRGAQAGGRLHRLGEWFPAAPNSTVSVPEAGAYEMRVRWYRYLSASNGCVRPAEGGWSTLVAEPPETVTITGSLLPHHC